jgi:hypothetical protein
MYLIRIFDCRFKVWSIQGIVSISGAASCSISYVKKLELLHFQCAPAKRGDAVDILSPLSVLDCQANGTLGSGVLV